MMGESYASSTIRTILECQTSDELIALYCQFAITFEKVNYTTHLEELDLLLGLITGQEIDNLTIVPTVEQILRIASERALAQLGVVFDDNIPMDLLAEAIDILLPFDPTDQPAVLKAALDAAEDADIALVRVLTMLGTREEFEWFDQIDDVDVNFVKNLRRVLVAAEELGEDDSTHRVLDAEFAKRISRLTHQKADSMGAIIAKQLEGDVSMEALYIMTVGNLIDASCEKAVDELFSLAAVTRCSFESAIKQVGTCLDDLYIDPVERQKAGGMVADIQNQYRPIFGDVE